MSGPDPVALLVALVDAHSVPLPNTGTREPILFLPHFGGSEIQHHGFPPDAEPEVDETVLEELHSSGMISIRYGEHGSMQIVPTAQGRSVAEEYTRTQSTEPSADISPVLAALSEQAKAANGLSWPAVRPVLAAMRDYWAAGGYSAFGIALQPILAAVPDDHGALFRATVRALAEGAYLKQTGRLSGGGLPAEVKLTDRAHSILDGWPGAAPAELVENLLAVLSEQVRTESDPTRKSRLQSVLKGIRELGIETASEVLAKVISGGM